MRLLCNCSANHSICMNPGKNSIGSEKKCVVCGENCGRSTLLDLFSGAGGAAYGYRKAGFCVLGIDTKFQPHYAGCKFHQADAFDYLRDHGREFDVIHASPPCQAYSSMRKGRWQERQHPDLIAPIRELIHKFGKPFVIENVYGAPLINFPLILCGTMFDLQTKSGSQLRRHRIFETSIYLGFVPPCRHTNGSAIGVYGGGQHPERRRPNTIGVWGNSGGSSNRDGLLQFGTQDRRDAMGIDWMTGNELSQAIPPAYTLWIGNQLMKVLK